LKSRRFQKNFWPKNKKNLGVPFAFFQILSQKRFVEFLTFDSWHCLGELMMMFTVIGCSFRQLTASKTVIQNARLSLQPPGRELPTFPVLLKSTKWALVLIIFNFPQSDLCIKMKIL